ncbi:MAG: peptidylprolyl isomerase, partial [Polaribacter sp.]
MKSSILSIVILFVSFTVFAQKNTKTLFIINGEKTSVSDFKRMYEKNLNIIDNEEAKSVQKNVDLYINYKLKVKEAYKMQLDTVSSYKREIETYKNKLSAPYLQDTTFIAKLLKDVYFRTKNELKAKHILIRLFRDATPKDTLVAYHKILKIRNRIVNGEDFEKVAVEVSGDKSAQNDPKTGRIGNKGNLGYFSAFRMVPPFEDVAYNTKVGTISMPFRTRFGYHI